MSKCLKRVQVRLDPHPKKHPETVEVWLIIARYKPNKQGKAGYFYFFCDFPHQDLTELEIMSKALNSYGQRWKIEQQHCQIKQDYKWEAIQLMSYTGLKNMNLLLLLSMCFLYSLKCITIQLMGAFPHIMKYSNRKWKQILTLSITGLLISRICVLVTFPNTTLLLSNGLRRTMTKPTSWGG